MKHLLAQSIPPSSNTLPTRLAIAGISLLLHPASTASTPERNGLSKNLPQPHDIDFLKVLGPHTVSMGSQTLQVPWKWRPDHILTAGALCMLHPHAVPFQLVTHAVSGLTAIALARGTSSTAAASMLAEGLNDTTLEDWREVLRERGDVLRR